MTKLTSKTITQALQDGNTFNIYGVEAPEYAVDFYLNWDASATTTVCTARFRNVMVATPFCVKTQISWFATDDHNGAQRDEVTHFETLAEAQAFMRKRVNRHKEHALSIAMNEWRTV